jgi:hypothetical protein
MTTDRADFVCLCRVEISNQPSADDSLGHYFLNEDNRSTMAAAEATTLSNKSDLESWLDLPLDQADSLLQALDPEVREISTFSLRCRL